jgi:hypothetical protein
MRMGLGYLNSSIRNNIYVYRPHPALYLSLTLHLSGIANQSSNTSDTSPRGVKRSRSPDTYGELPTGDGGADDGTSV